MKALFFVNSVKKGGAEKVCMTMAKELLEQNYKVDFIVVNHDEKPEIDGINIFSLDLKSQSKIGKVFNILSSIKKVNKFIRESEKQEKYDLITSHLPVSNMITRFSCVNKKSIYVFHTKIENYKIINNFIYKFLLKLVFGKRKIVTVSKGLEEEAINKYNFESQYVKTIYNPIDYDKIGQLSKEKIDFDCPYFIQVGRFNSAKRQDRMLKVFHDGGFYKKYKLVFCGVGELEDNAKKIAEELGIYDRVAFLGWQDNVYKWIDKAVLLISTSDYEAFPINLIEAAACGTPIVSSDCNYGPREILLGDYSNFLVNPDNISEYIEKINKALTSYPTTKNSIIEECSVKKIVTKYILYYNNNTNI